MRGTQVSQTPTGGGVSGSGKKRAGETIVASVPQTGGRRGGTTNGKSSGGIIHRKAMDGKSSGGIIHCNGKSSTGLHRKAKSSSGGIPHGGALAAMILAAMIMRTRTLARLRIGGIPAQQDLLQSQSLAAACAEFQLQLQPKRW